jgi:pSer/pThr/pTyr-binding forkhead associated (FHA) protein
MAAQLSIIEQASGKENIYIIDRTLIIGRSPRCDIYIEDTQSSRQHCKIYPKEGRYCLEDIDSHNGTYVNGEKVKLQFLQTGDKIKIGSTILLFQNNKEKAADEPSGKVETRWESDITDLPVLRVKEKGKAAQIIPLQPDARYTLGRNEDNRIRLTGSQISGNHAEIIWQNEQWRIQDLQSRNGVYVNSKKISDSISLQLGDVVVLGETRCIFEMPRNSRTTNPCYALWVPTGVAILVFVCAFLVGKKMLTPVKPYPVPPIVGNLLEDFSFEQGFGWQLQHGMTISHAMAKNGQAALFFSSPALPQPSDKEAMTVYEACSLDSVSLPYAKAYTVSAWLNFARLRGIAGIKLKWLTKQKESVFTEAYSPLVTGDSATWQPLEFIAYPPPLAEQVKLFCFVAGTAEHVAFDDVVLREKTAGYTPTNSKDYLENAPLRAYVDARGVLDIYHGPHLVVGSGKLLVWNKDKQLFANQAFSIGKASWHSHDVVWQGTLYSLPDFVAWAELTTKCETIPDGLQWSIALKPHRPQPEYSVDFALVMPPEYGSHKMKIGSKEVGRCYEKMPANIEQEASYLMWDVAWDKFAFFYPTPTLCSLNMSDYALHLRQQMSAATNWTWTMQIRTNLFKESELLQEWEVSAEQHEKQGETGKAYAFYQQIADKFIFHPAAENARTKLQTLSLSFQQDLLELTTRGERAAFFQSLAAYDELTELYKTLQNKWQKLPILAKLDAVWQKIESNRRQASDEQYARATHNWQQLAQQYENEHKLALALACYLEALKYLAPERYTHMQKKIKELQESLAQDSQ